MTRTSNLSALLLSALVAVALLLSAGAAHAAEGLPEVEDAFVQAINDSRAAEGLEPLVVNDELTAIARAWSAQMDAAGELRHNPNYSAEYSGDWNRMGENVGYTTWPGADPITIVPRLHDAFMDSPGHRANIMGGYNQLGVGVVMAGDTLWVTVNFLQGPLVESEPEVIVVPDAPAPVLHHFVRR